MGRPIKKELIGGSNVPSGNNMLVIDKAFIPGASAVSTNVTIVRQKGTGRYIVTDGTNTGLVHLVDGSNGYTPVSGEAIANVAVYTSKTVEETIYTPATSTLNSGGTGYKVGDKLVIPNVVDITVSTVDDSGVITAVTNEMSVKTSSTDMAGKNVAASGGTGTGATFDITSTSTTTSEPVTDTEYAFKIFNRTVVTYEDNVYSWDLNSDASKDGQADLTTIKKS